MIQNQQKSTVIYFMQIINFLTYLKKWSTIYSKILVSNWANQYQV